jgi:SWI/SNF-related matrix-associated actin-dependent regulator 1 of chromatin subfamily A
VQLDYNARTGAYFLRVKRTEANVQELMQDYGLDFSVTASTSSTAVLVTHEPFAAVTFIEHGTPAAKANLSKLADEIAASWKEKSSGHFAVPADKELWSFQSADIEYALRRRNTLIADQPGLGKTEVAIVYCNETKARRVLVICPANIRLQWAERIRQWSTMEWGYRVYPILSGRHGVHPEAEWTIVSYDLARTPAIGAALAKGTYDVLILDEVHYLKTVDSRRTRAIFGGGEDRKFGALAERAGSILALSGTPLPNRPREAYTVARALNFDSIDFLSEEKFKERFNPSVTRDGVRGDGTPYVYVDERTGRHAELQNRLRANFMVRHLKRDVMPQLKLPIYDIVQLEETGPVKQALHAESLLDIDPENLEGADAEILGHIAVVRRQMGVALAPQVASYANMLLEGGEEKLVIFGWHIEVLNILEQHLARWGTLRIDGSTSQAAKQRKVKEFQEDPRKQVMLGNTLSLGTGTDGLQNVSAHALLAEPDWTPGNNEQAIDRLDRGGQLRTVQADLFVAPRSIAERVLASALRKKQITHKALDRR